MKLKSLFVAMVFLTCGSVFARTWVAICKDGKGIQYNQDENGTGFLYMKVKDSNGQVSTYQIAKLKKTFYNGIAI